jgi:bifunctional enzyme CysN/CysC
MNDAPMDPALPYALFHTTRQVRAFVERVEYRVDVDTLHREQTPTLGLNEIGRVEITTSEPIFFDSYRVNIATGSFVLIDPHTNVTVAAGMIRGEVRRVEEATEAAARPAGGPVSPNVTWEGWNVSRAEREALNGHRAAVVWFTGMSGAGKTTIARQVERRLFEQGVRTMLLDGDQVRHGLCGDLGFTPEDRTENIRRVGEVAKLFFEQGCVVLCTFVSPYRKDRDAVRSLIPEGRFFEIHVHAPLEELKRRDPKGLYRGEAEGGVGELPGSAGAYEAPERASLRVDTAELGVEKAVAEVLARLRAGGVGGG